MNQLPPGWERTRLGDLVTVSYGKGLSARDRDGSGYVPVVGSAGVAGTHSASLVDEPVIVIGRKGNAGSVWSMVGPSWPIDTTYFLRVPRDVDQSFLSSQLDFLRLGQLDSSTAVPSLRRQDLEAAWIVLPPRAEQERIVAAIEEHLTRLDSASAVLSSALERISVLARAGIRQLFDTAHWRWTTLGEIAEIKGGVTKDSKRQSDPSFVEVPYLRVANVQRGRLDLSEVTTIRVHPEKATSLRLEPGDVLMNEGGDRDKLGRGWVWEDQIKDCIHQNHVFRARLTDDFDPYFVSTHANTWGQAWFEEHGRQTTNLASINIGTLKQLPVPAPPRSEQQAIVAQLQASTQAQKRLEGSIGQAQTHARALRHAILTAAFSGQLAPQDAGDEPASVFLDRIRAERAVAGPVKRSRKAKAS